MTMATKRKTTTKAEASEEPTTVKAIQPKTFMQELEDIPAHQVERWTPPPLEIGSEFEALEKLVDIAVHNCTLTHNYKAGSFDYTGGTAFDLIVDGLRTFVERWGNDPEFPTLWDGFRMYVANCDPGHCQVDIRLAMREIDAGKGRIYDRMDQLAPRSTGTNGPVERLKWKSSTAAFAHIFRTLAAQGYFDLPRKNGKGNDPNTAAFARMLLQAFEVPGKDGEPITPEVLRVRLADGAPGRLADTKAAKFQIPEPGELIVPNAGELE